MRPYDHPRAVRALGWILAVAVVVSLVHYTDNYVNYDDFPQATTGPNPSASVVLPAWFAFTAAGLAGYLLFRRGPSDLALLLLAGYAVSGLIGIGHYLVPGATSMPWWRQLSVGLDFASGVAVIGFAIWASRARRRDQVAPTSHQVPQ